MYKYNIEKIKHYYNEMKSKSSSKLKNEMKKEK